MFLFQLLKHGVPLNVGMEQFKIKENFQFKVYDKLNWVNLEKTLKLMRIIV